MIDDLDHAAAGGGAVAIKILSSGYGSRVTEAAKEHNWNPNLDGIVLTWQGGLYYSVPYSSVISQRL